MTGAYMESALRHQVEHAIKVSKQNGTTLALMLELLDKIQPGGWTPKIYDQAVRELYRVQMCVVHRSLVLDLIRVLELVEVDALPERVPHDKDDDDPPFTKIDLTRVRDGLAAALKGLSPNEPM